MFYTLIKHEFWPNQNARRVLSILQILVNYYFQVFFSLKVTISKESTTLAKIWENESLVHMFHGISQSFKLPLAFL